MKPRTKTAGGSLGAPYLRRVESVPEMFDRTRHPFDVPAFSRGINLAFRTPVTFFVGENGSGKSTLLEALAECCGFAPEGGSRDHDREALAERSGLAQALRLSWIAFLRIIHDLATPADAQFLIATHSPILLGYPGAVLLSLDGDSFAEVECRETEHYRVSRDFLNAPERYFKHLFRDEGDERE